MKYLILIASLYYQFGFAQSAESERTIRSNFSVAAITAYQESSGLKLMDFYHYLEIWSDQNSSPALKDQVKENILTLIKYDGISIPDFTSSVDTNLALNAFLDKIQGQNLKFSLKNVKAGALSSDSWMFEYDVDTFNGNSTNSKTVRQKVYFSPELKSFGKSQKLVWTQKLGEME